MTIGGVLKLGKRAVALDVANTLFRVYAHLREYRLMGTVLDNLTNAGIPLSTANFSKATLVTFNWYAGTHNLHSEHFLLARDHLTVAYELLHPSFVATRHRILIPLLAVSAILGYTAPPAVFARPEAQGLWALFNPLYYALRKGDFRAFRCALGDADPAGRGGVEDTRWRRAFWQRHRLYYVLRHRCQPLLWRALIRKVWTLTPVAAGGAGGVTGAGGAGGGAGMPKVAIADVAACARALGEDVSDVDVEAMALGCLEQGLIRGYIAPMQAGAYVVLTKGGGKFPSVASLWRQARWQRPVEEVAAGGGRVLRLKGVRGVGG
ncbi:hypothetical protein EDC01DRAFT_613957 [Geopyxis carbonaria]|nr:hypothetical protein EDC01DRAFT_613957 [Geopyxis carbonaria]